MALSLRLILPALLASSTSGIINQPLAIFTDWKGREGLVAQPERALRSDDGVLGPLRGGQQSWEQPGPGTSKPIQLNPPPGSDKPTSRQKACLRIDSHHVAGGSRGKGRRGRWGGRGGVSSVSSSGTDPPKPTLRCVSSLRDQENETPECVALLHTRLIPA